MYDCAKCGKELDLQKDIWDYVLEEFECEHCGALLIMQSDSSYDPESGEEYLWFMVESVVDKDTK